MLPSSGHKGKALTFLKIMVQTTWYPNAEDHNINLHYYKNLKSSAS
jgi:hypothetical protein